jgi:hypothetical protein
MNTISRPPKFPLVIALLACLFAGTINFIPTLKLSPLIYFAYLLTPFIPIGMMAIIQTKDAASRSNIQYRNGHKFTYGSILGIKSSDNYRRLCAYLIIVYVARWSSA